MATKLKLVWPHKGEHVFQNPETGKWEFCGSDPLPPRPLIEISAYGSEKGKPFDPERGNLLIKGENLFALRALLPYYAGKVKLIYIDPPFNTGQEFIHYDDNFEHSVWLSMMEERLQLLKALLTEDGAMFVQIDDYEHARLKVLMDEVFGPSNFRNSIIIKRGTKSVQAQFETIDSLAAGHDYLLFYSRFPTARFKKLTIPLPEPESGTWNNHWRGTDRPTMRYKLFGIKPKRGQWRWSKERSERAIQNYKLYQKKYAKKMAIDEYWLWYYKKYGKKLDFLRLSARGKPEHYVPPRSERLGTDVWMGVRTRGTSTDFETEKHVDLISRLIDWTATDDNDLVLDCFAGSGTTGVAAHIKNKRWIMVEINSPTVDETLKRMKSAIKSKGGFRFLEVGAPLLVKDNDTQLTILNPNYTNGPLIRAVCAIEGFLLTGDSVLHGRNMNHFAHVTEDFVDDAYIQRLRRRLNNNQVLTVYALKVKRGLKPPKGVSVKRMNVDLVKPYLSKERH